MTEEARLPLETTLGEAGSHATDTFALLASETRLAILLVLWEAYDPHASDNVVSFSTIFDRLDLEDPGTVSYHLQQLTGQFITQYPEGGGYELRVPALRFIHAVIGGAGVQDAVFEPTELDQPCPFCGAPTAITYREGLVVHVCTGCEGVTAGEDVEGYLSAVPFDPAGLAERSPPEIRAASRVAAWRQTQLMVEGLCPACSGRVDGWLACCGDHDADGICGRCGSAFRCLGRFECRTCKNHNVSSPKALAFFHPAVTAFYENHDVPTRLHADDVESVQRVFDCMGSHEVTVTGTEPPAATVTVSRDDDALQVHFDEHAAVTAVRRSGG